MGKGIEFRLLPKQSTFVRMTERLSLFSGGVGSGKTYAVIVKIIVICGRYPGVLGVVGAQTFPVIRNVIIREFFSICPADIIQNWNRSTWTLTFKNGSEIIFLSFDDETKLRGITCGFAAAVELTTIKYDSFDMLRTRLRQPNAPRQLFSDTNPDTLDHWVYKGFLDPDTKFSGSAVVLAKTSDNKYLPQDYIDDMNRMKDVNEAYYNRMVLGKWGRLEGLIYNLPLDQRLPLNKMPINPKYPQSNKKAWKADRYIAGLDFGFKHPTAMVIIAESNEHYYQVDEFYAFNLTSSEIIERAKFYCDEYNIESLYCDYSRPEIIEDLQRAGLPAINANKAVFEGIMYLKSLIGEKRLYISTDCAHTLREFDSYVWDSKNLVKEIPIKKSDDTMDALRYCLFTGTRDDTVEAFEFEFA